MIKKMILLLLAALLPLVAFAETQKKVTFKIATLAPKGSMTAEHLDQLKKDILTLTDKKVKFKVYYGGVHGDAKNVLNKMKVKQLHGAMMAGYGLGQIVPEVRVTSLPYLFKNYGEVEYVREKLNDQMEKAFIEKGYVVLGWYDVGFVYSFSKVPITSVEIARQQKFWAPEGDPLAQAAYRSIGISPVSLSLTDVLTSLSTKLIDAASAPPIAAVGFRWHTKFKYMTEYPSSSVLGALVVTKERWDQVTPQNQTRILEKTRRFGDEIREGFKRQNRKCIDIMKKSGISIVRVQNAEGYRKFIQEMSRKTIAATVGEMYPQTLLDTILSNLETYRKEHPNSGVEKID